MTVSKLRFLCVIQVFLIQGFAVSDLNKVKIYLT